MNEKRKGTCIDQRFFCGLNKQQRTKNMYSVIREAELEKKLVPPSVKIIYYGPISQ